MPAEQLAGNQVTERSDFYSLGASLYHLITGRPPFESMTAALTRKPAPPPACDLNSACSKELAEALISLLEEVPHKRPSSAAEVAGLIGAPGGAAQDDLPLKPRLMRPVFVGREKERSLLLESLEHSCKENSLRAIRVAGECGIGKSWLFHSSGLKTRAELEKEALVLASSFRQDGLGKIFLQDPATEFSAGFRKRFGGPEPAGEEQPALAPRESREGANDSVITEAAELLRGMASFAPWWSSLKTSRRPRMKISNCSSGWSRPSVTSPSWCCSATGKRPGCPDLHSRDSVSGLNACNTPPPCGWDSWRIMQLKNMPSRYSAPGCRQLPKIPGRRLKISGRLPNESAGEKPTFLGTSKERNLLAWPAHYKGSDTRR